MGSAIFLFGSLIFFLLSGLLIFGFFRHYSHHDFNKSIHSMGLIAFSYITLLLFSSLWFFDVLEYNLQEFVAIYAIVIFAQTILLFLSLRFFIGSRKLLPFLLLYLISFVSITSSLSTFFFILLTTSYFLTLILFIIFLQHTQQTKRASYMGISYAIVSLVLHFIFLFAGSFYYYFSLVSAIIFGIFCWFFIRDMDTYSFTLQKKESSQEGYLIKFLRYFVFVIILTTFILMATIGIHEFGHVLFAKFADCSYQTIIFEEGSSAHTEVFCDDLSQRQLALLAGPTLPALLAFVLFFLGGKFIQEVAFLVFGFNLLASYRDLTELGIGTNLVVFSSIIGMIFLLLGVLFLSRSRVEEHALVRFHDL